MVQLKPTATLWKHWLNHNMNTNSILCQAQVLICKIMCGVGCFTMAMVIKILLTKKYKLKGLKVANSDQVADRHMIGHDGWLAWLKDMMAISYDSERLRGGGLLGMIADRYYGCIMAGWWQMQKIANRRDTERLRGFDNGQTDRQMDNCNCRVAFATEKVWYSINLWLREWNNYFFPLWSPP